MRIVNTNVIQINAFRGKFVSLIQYYQFSIKKSLT